ncbi:MAG: type II secretion system protein M [Betaproteobacteria bacterium]|nr:type II secretion system protein M [Betaproteobacteria bacterium]
MKPWMQYWSGLAARFDALSRRERALLAAALLLLVGYGGGALLVQPSLTRAAIADKNGLRAQNDLANVRAQLAALALAGDPNAPTKAALADSQRQLQSLDERLRRFEDGLVSPEQVPQLLADLLNRSKGLRLVALRKLPVTGIIERPAPAGTPATAAPGAPPVAQGGVDGIPGSNVFRHGVELQIEGSYPALLTYLAELEKSPEHVIWGGVKLKVGTYPLSVLTVTVYTLSLDKTWLLL